MWRKVKLEHEQYRIQLYQNHSVWKQKDNSIGIRKNQPLKESTESSQNPQKGTKFPNALYKRYNFKSVWFLHLSHTQDALELWCGWLFFLLLSAYPRSLSLLHLSWVSKALLTHNASRKHCGRETVQVLGAGEVMESIIEATKLFSEWPVAPYVTA